MDECCLRNTLFILWFKTARDAAESGDGFFVLQPSAVALDAKLDRVKQILVAERLCQELDRPTLHRRDRHRDIAIARDKDDREVDVRGRELSLKVKAATPGQSHVKHE